MTEKEFKKGENLKPKEQNIEDWNRRKEETRDKAKR